MTANTASAVSAAARGDALRQILDHEGQICDRLWSKRDLHRPRIRSIPALADFQSDILPRLNRLDRRVDAAFFVVGQFGHIVHRF
jgi:hypothetical protein